MAVLSRWLLVLLLVGAAPTRDAFGAMSEKGLFSSAADAFKDGFYQKAEQDAALFISQFTNSARLPEAILLQAQSRLKMTNYDGAIQLLSGGEAQAGKLADEYVFWIGSALSQKGDLRGAADTFARLTKSFPASDRRLEAAIDEAELWVRMGEWPRVLESLKQPDGAFQVAVKANTKNEWVAHGYLLLAEAQFTTGDYASAEASLQPLGQLPMGPDPAWERQYLICRVQAQTGRKEEALSNATNLVAMATKAASIPLIARSTGFHAGLLESLGRLDEAIGIYTRNLSDGIPPDAQRRAILKITELSLARNRVAEAAQMLERFATNHPDASEVNVALATLGELRLRQHLGTVTNATMASNFLRSAQSALNSVLTNNPPVPLAARARLGLGWSFWLESRLPEAEAAFEYAATNLPPSVEQATARFKLADTQFKLNKFAPAATNYAAIVANFGAMPEVRTNLFEPALYAGVRAALAAGDAALATDLLGKLLASFPNSFLADRAVLLTGQAETRQGNPAAARELFRSFLQANPQAPLRSEISLAIARTWEREEKWDEAIREYSTWLTTFTNNPAQPRAEYYRARAYFHTHQETNAISSFTNMLARFPTDELAPLARWWVADYYYGIGDFNAAEINYQLLYQNTNWASTEVGYQAKMMAGRAAAARLGWEDAKPYFLALYNDTNCPPDLRNEALFAYGDYWMSRDSKTNKVADYEEAIRVFTRIYESGPTNRLGLRALGQKALCLLQWPQPEGATNALQAFGEIAASPYADATARAIAYCGMAVTLENQARKKTGAEQAALLEQALNHYLDAFYFEKYLRSGEQPDAFWVTKAGKDAAALAEQTQRWQQAINIYTRLKELFPPLTESLDKRILKASEGLATQTKVDTAPAGG